MSVLQIKILTISVPSTNKLVWLTKLKENVVSSSSILKLSQKRGSMKPFEPPWIRPPVYSIQLAIIVF